MKKTLVTILIALYASLQNISADDSLKNKSISRETKIVQESYKPKYNTLFHLALDLESKEFDVPISTYKRLDYLLEECVKGIKKKESYSTFEAKDIFGHINCVLTNNQVSYGQAPLLSTAIDSNQLICSFYSMFYYSVGQVADLPIKIMNVPGHRFVKWDLSGDEDLNWETTYGWSPSDNHYLKNFAPSHPMDTNEEHIVSTKMNKIIFDIKSGITAKLIDETNYSAADKYVKEFINSSNNYIRAVGYNYGARIFYNKKDYDQSMQYIDKSLELDNSPVFKVILYANKAELWMLKGDLGKAKKFCTKATNLIPSYKSGEIKMFSQELKQIMTFSSNLDSMIKAEKSTNK